MQNEQTPAAGALTAALDEALTYIEKLGENIERNDVDMHLDTVERPFSFAQTMRSRFDELCRPHVASPASSSSEDEDQCGICLNGFAPDDICATDVDLGTCHAACLEGSPIVDSETGEEKSDATPFTYRYGSLPHPKTSFGVDQAPDFGFPTNEPSPRQMIEHYYRSNGMSDWQNLADQYCAALAPASLSSVVQGDAGGVEVEIDDDHLPFDMALDLLCTAEDMAVYSGAGSANVAWVARHAKTRLAALCLQPSGESVNRECKACGAFNPDRDAACTFCGHAPVASSDQPEQGALEADRWTNEDIEDLISDAIGDSMDMDSTHRDGAKAVLAALHKEGFLRFDLPAEPAEARVRVRVREAERKSELYDHMKTVAEANGFKSLTEAIARATAAEAKLARMRAALEKTRDPLSTAKMWAKRKGGCDGAIDKIDRALFSVKQALQEAGEVG